MVSNSACDVCRLHFRHSHVGDKTHGLPSITSFGQNLPIPVQNQGGLIDRLPYVLFLEEFFNIDFFVIWEGLHLPVFRITPRTTPQ